ncbi:MAG: hypothetical protein ACMXYB_00235 [Candidatus Woesearchaeota archaeon]
MLSFKEYFDTYCKYKKSQVTDIPNFILLQMLIGIAFLLLVILPIYNIFQVEDYNRDVAMDVVYSIVDFVDYMDERVESSSIQCMEELKLSYLANPQIMESNRDSYVIVITSEYAGLITYEDYQRLVARELDSDFNSFNNRLFANSIDMRSFTIDNSISQDDDVNIIFLIPSGIYESSLLIRSSNVFFGDSKSGYHISYLVREGNDFVLKPGSRFHENLLNSINERLGRDVPTNTWDRNLYSFGFVSYQGNYFGPLITNADELSILNTCNIASFTDQLSPDNPNSPLNTKGIMCTAFVEFEGDSREDMRIRSNIYWNSGYQCGSEYLGERNFCQELRQDSQTSYIFSLGLNERREEIKESFISFCGEFFSNMFPPEKASLEIEIKDLEEEDRFITNNQFNFFDFFQRVPDETIVQYVNANTEENFFYERPNLPPTQECSISRDQITIDENSLCNYIIEFNTQNSQQQRRQQLAFYIHTQDTQHRGFYVVKDEHDFLLHRNSLGSLEFRLGDRILPFNELNKVQANCPYIIFRNRRCEHLNLIELEIHQYLFDNILHPNFEVYLTPKVLASNRRTSNVLQPSFFSYFTLIDEFNNPGKFNPQIEINSQDYILNTMFMTPQIERINGEIYPNSDIKLTHLEFSIVDLNTAISYDILNPSRSRNVVNFNFPNENINIEYELFFEQLLYSIYDSQELRTSKVREEIKNFDVVLVPHQSEISGNYQTIFYLRTKTTNRLIFEKKELENGNTIYSPALLTINTQYIEREIDENDLSLRKEFIFPKMDTQGNIQIETIPIELSYDEFDILLENSNIDEHVR